jgi:uncharacterized protein (UPF0332 family)
MKMFDWQEYYLLARVLLSQAESSTHKEAMFRSAVSRAYYAAFHRACNYLREMDEYPTQQEFKSSRKETHKFLIDMFTDNLDHPERCEIGDMLQSLKSLRHQADYQKSVEKHMFRRKKMVEPVIDKAREVIDLIDSL